LDAEKAFDVVDHIHLFWKINHQDITGSTWLLIKELHRKKITQVKSGGEISKPYVNYQGVKQGEILSAGFYKAYINDILNTFERSDMGFKNRN
jgi:REP element-mobilizing transposase RayT